MNEDSLKARSLQALAGVYNRKYDEDSVFLMLNALAGVSASDLKQASARLVKYCQFMPSVAEILKDIEENRPSESKKPLSQMSDEEFEQRIKTKDNYLDKLKLGDY